MNLRPKIFWKILVKTKNCRILAIIQPNQNVMIIETN